MESIAYFRRIFVQILLKFFIKFEDNIEYIRGEAENISILSENLMKKVEIQGVFPDGNTNEKEKL